MVISASVSNSQRGATTCSSAEHVVNGRWYCVHCCAVKRNLVPTRTLYVVAHWRGTDVSMLGR
jgi:hypothetical protein